MEKSYETFEGELGAPSADPPPLKPVRQICRPDMHTTRKIREEMAPVSQQPKAEARTLPKDPAFPRPASLHKTTSIQNLTQIQTPWENVTLNRCLFVAITILVLTSGFQRLQETLRGQRTVEEEEVGLTVRRTGLLRYEGQPSKPETSLWEVMFWWLPDLDDEEEDEDRGVKRGRSKKGAKQQMSRGLRNKPLLDKSLLKQRNAKLKDRRAKKARANETKDKKDTYINEDLDDTAGENEDQVNGEETTEVNIRMEKKKEKKNTQKG